MQPRSVGLPGYAPSLPEPSRSRRVRLWFNPIMEPDRWAALSVRHLLAFDAVAQERSFRAAAGRLGYTQSAVSQQIQALERIVGQRLVERTAGQRAVALTEAGELLLVHGARMLARAEAAQADLAALEAGSAGTLRVGIYQSAGARILPRVMARFAADWPRVQVRLTELADGFELLALVERGGLDLTFTALPLVEGPFEAVELLRDDYVLLAPAGSPLAASARQPRLADICGEPLIAWRQTRAGRGIEDRLRALGHDPEVIFRSDDSATLQGLVAAGVGVALVPRLTVDEDDPDVAVVALGDQLPPRIVAIAWHRDRHRSAAGLAFVDVARDVCAARQGRLAAA